MELCIERGRPIADIQREFTQLYPFLKIELLDRKKTVKVVKGDSFAGKCQHIDISAGRTVEDLENDFRQNFDLPVQVFRRAGSLWIETSLTHDWTLEQQNKEGELFSNIHSGLSKK